MTNRLTSPFDLGNRTFKNRMIAAPPSSLTGSFEGLVTADTIDYYQRLAETGVCAVIVEATAVSAKARAWSRQLDAGNDDALPGLSQLTERIRRGGALPFLQLYHAGINALIPSGSRIYGPGQPRLRKINTPVTALDQKKIDRIIDEYVGAAIMAWNAGFSGIEIAAADGSLVHQFLSPLTNPRTDEYGCKNVNGALFARQIVRGIKKVAPDLTLSVKLSLKDLLPGGNGLKQAFAIAELLKKEGIDIFNLTEGLIAGSNPLMIHPAVGNIAPETPFAEDAQIFRHEVDHPVILSGKIGRPAGAEQKIAREICDFVALGRTLNRCPNWPAQATNSEFYQAPACLRCKVCVAATTGCPDQKIPFARIL
jgi:2,4-dienoyl-CoA reductase-like NADH-dependent reductase (Old Yellow Enzyme family)